MPLLPDTLSLDFSRSGVPPRLFYGFPLELSDAVRILKKVDYLEVLELPFNFSNKEAFLEDHIASIFPFFVDNLIKLIHESLGLPQENIILTFFADTIVDDEEITLFTIGDSWQFNHLPLPSVTARLARFLGKGLKKEDLPCYYLAANEDGLWQYGGSQMIHFSGGGNGKWPVESVR